MRRIAIDTNIYAAFKSNDMAVVEALENCDHIGVDVTVVAELLSGFKMGNREKLNRAELEKFLDTPRIDILHHNMETAEYYSIIVRRLKTKGRPIPVNDIWIASNAMRDGLALYSLDTHFCEIDGLILVK